MEFDNSFEVPLPPAQAWKVLTDIERIAPCMPGAELTEVVDPDTYKGRIAVRLGPVALTFAGVVKFEERDETNYSARIAAQGTDAKGRGGANSVATIRLEPAGGGSKVLVHTNLTLVGIGRAIRPRRRHHPGHRHAADEPVRQVPEGEAGAGWSGRRGSLGRAAAIVAVDRSTISPGGSGQADFRLCADHQSDLEFDRRLVQAFVGWVERLRETQHRTANVTPRDCWGSQELDPTYGD